jgi:coenzyme F420-reducing hydrogenase gamma subunit
MFVQRGAANTTAPALCTNHVSAKHARSRNDELKQETIEETYHRSSSAIFVVAPSYSVVKDHSRVKGCPPMVPLMRAVKVVLEGAGPDA